MKEKAKKKKDIQDVKLISSLKKPSVFCLKKK